MAYIDVSAVTGVTLLAGIDPVTRDMFLSAATVGTDVNPIDIYKEMRTCRSELEVLRPYNVFLRAFGNDSKGGGKFTERYVRCEEGTRIVPYDITHVITITGTIITDDGQEGVDCFDRTPLNVSSVVDINYVPPQVEVITVNTGSGVTPADITAIAVAVWNYTTRVLTSAGAGGATAQEVWEYATRELTSSAGVTPQDISDIADAVWDEALAGHTTAGTAGEKLDNVTANVDTGAIATAVWGNGTRTLTEAAGVTPTDISDIADAVWTEPSRTLTGAVGVTAQNIIDIADAVWDEDLTGHAISNSAGERLTINLDIGDIPNISAAVWGEATRELTSTLGLTSGDLTSIGTAVWASASRSLTAPVNVSAASSDALAQDVWQNVTRTLTDPVDVSTTSQNAITANVWTETTREITNIPSLDPADIAQIVTDVWNNSTRTLTTAPAMLGSDITAITDSVWDELLAGHVVVGSAGEQLSNVLTSLDTAAISSAVWSAGTRELTSALNLTAQDLADIVDGVWDETAASHNIAGSLGESLNTAANSVDTNAIASAVWSETTRTLTATLAPSANAIATAVWAAGNRTITETPALLTTDIDAITAQVWTEPGRTLTSIIEPNPALIATEVWLAGNRTLTSSNDPTASAIATAVWAEATRTLSDPVLVQTNTINDIRDAVWTAPARLLTGDVTINSTSITDISSDVWGHVSRTLTGDVDVASANIAVISAAVWSNPVRDLTVDMGLASTTIDDISAAVWSDSVRTLTDTGLTGIESTMLRELWQVGGLDPSNPVTNTQTQTTVDAINIQYTGNSKTAVTATRQ